MSNFTESVVEEAALSWLESLGWTLLHGPEIAACTPGAERSDPGYRDAVLEGRIRQALVRLNPDPPPDDGGHIMWFLEVLDRRRYELDLVNGSLERFKATSRRKIES